jgi:hypothetical protein
MDAPSVVGLTGEQPAPEKLSPVRRRYNRPAARAAGWGILAGLTLVPVAAARAQSVLFPDGAARFEFPLASPRASAMVGRIIHVSRGESRFGAEWEAEPALGEVWPLLAISSGRVPVTLHLGSEVYGRFSLSDKSSALISSDWHVNAILTADLRRWHLALEGYHESSHLGDEYAERFTVQRVNWSREILGLWLGYTVGAVQLRGNASWAAIDALNRGRGSAALAAEWRGRALRGLGPRVRPVLAGFANAEGYTGWDVTWSARAGLRLADPDGRRAMAFLLNFLDGRSPQRQFYLSRTRYLGVEVRFDL